VIPVPEGYAGLVLRGAGSGGHAGDVDVRALLAQVPTGTRVLVDWPHPPEQAGPNAEGIVLSDVMLGFLAGPGLTGRLERLVVTLGDSTLPRPAAGR
jgi:hypothetical protein